LAENTVEARWLEMTGSEQNWAMSFSGSLPRLAGLLIIVGSSMGAGQLYAQNPAPRVSVTTIVVDKDYKPLSDLREEQFELRVDGKETPLSDFRKDAGPVSAVIVLDASSNMKSVLEQSQDALQGFFRWAGPDDEYALVVSQGYNKSWIEVPFTSDQDRIRKGFLAVTAHGAAPLFDSLEIALDLVKQGKNDHRVVLAISDGFDKGSNIKFKKLRSDVLASTASLYALEVFAGRAHEDIDTETLEELTELSGGVFFDDVSTKRFTHYFGNLDLHQRYILTFQPASPNRDGKRHHLDVRLHDMDSNKPKVFWRPTYEDARPLGVH
jgi:VWFA-related protein